MVTTLDKPSSLIHEIQFKKVDNWNLFKFSNSLQSQMEILLQKKKDDALVQANIKAKQNADAAAAAKSQLDWVRDYNQRSAAAISTSTCTSVRDYATTVNTVFGECTVALEELARKADGHALDANTLIKSWPTNKETK